MSNATRQLSRFRSTLASMPNARVEANFLKTGKRPTYHKDYKPPFESHADRLAFAQDYGQPDRDVSRDIARVRAKFLSRRYVPAGALNWSEK